MKTAKEIITSLKTQNTHCFIKFGDGGHKLLTLSYRPGKGFRYFKGNKPGGGGRKHTPITELRALELLS